jgi:hypothetical protein
MHDKYLQNYSWQELQTIYLTVRPLARKAIWSGIWTASRPSKRVDRKELPRCYSQLGDCSVDEPGIWNKLEI